MVVAALMVVATVAPALAASEVTVGRFVQELALHKNLDAADVSTAVDSLRAVGVRLPADLDMSAGLTEGDVVSISRAIGLRVSTSNPTTPFDESQVESFFFSLGDELGDTDQEIITYSEDPYHYGENEDGPPFDPFKKGKGHHKGKCKGHESPEEPE
jgi:hypothetical protein